MSSAMSERKLQAAIVELAQLLGWLVYHTYDSRRSAPGFPDLVMVRKGHAIFAELKTAAGRISPDQRLWLDMLGAVSVAEDRVQVFEWRPEHWLNGTIEQVLR